LLASKICILVWRKFFDDEVGSFDNGYQGLEH